MKFVRTLLIITALVLGWVVIRAESSAHGLTYPAGQTGGQTGGTAG